MTSASIIVDTPIGPLTLEATPQGLTRIRFGSYPGIPSQNPISHLDDAAKQLQEYFAGTRKTFDLAFDVVGTPFQERVWALLPTIPYGKTSTYGHLATLLGNQRLSRAIGHANGANPIPIVRPCHRVIGHDRRLTGFSGGLEKKAFLLDHEASQIQLLLFQE